MARNKKSAKAGNVYCETLIDSWHSVRKDTPWELDSSTFSSAGDGLPYWSLAFDCLYGGKQDGVDVLQVDNGVMSFSILPTRGMNIFECYCDDVRLGWDSPVEEIVNPKFMNLQSRGGVGFLEGFNEWFVRCGMSSNGAPCEEGTLHGRIANTPASMLSVEVLLEAPYTITIRGAVRETCFFQENLLLETAIITQPGANWLHIQDTVTNLSAAPGEMQMLYHINYGQPLLGEGTKLIVPSEFVSPVGAVTADRMKKWNVYREAGSMPSGEEVMAIKPKADRNGIAYQMLKNAAGDLAVLHEQSAKALPWLVQWKKEGDLEDGYVTGIEPSTNLPNPKPFERKNRRVVKLGAGKSWNSSLTVSLLQGKSEVQKVQKKLNSLQGRKAPEIHLEPQKGISTLA